MTNLHAVAHFIHGYIGEICSVIAPQLSWQQASLFSVLFCSNFQVQIRRLTTSDINFLLEKYHIKKGYESGYTKSGA